MKDWQHLLPLDSIKTPAYVICTDAIERNLRVIQGIKRRTGCKVLHALKAFALCPVFPLMSNYLDGVTASSLYEARLGKEYFGKEVHVCSPAYSDEEFGELLTYVDHVVFNSLSQVDRFMPRIKKVDRSVGAGLRVNPQHSEVDTALYDPCAEFSRLGVTADMLESVRLDDFDGLHFHTLCELNSDALSRTLEVVEKNFKGLLHQVRWVNFGGGHHISRPDYDTELLCKEIRRIMRTYDVQVYIEPGEGIVLNTGALVSSVLDIVENRKHIAILDASASCHMPDVLEMPYRPMVLNAGNSRESAFEYRLAGNTCLAGDMIGDYLFRDKLHVGDKLSFLDMAHYTMVKTTTFNGVALPRVYLFDSGSIELTEVCRDSYTDFKKKMAG